MFINAKERKAAEFLKGETLRYLLSISVNVGHPIPELPRRATPPAPRVNPKSKI
jgi:hypothetical protein